MIRNDVNSALALAQERADEGWTLVTAYVDQHNSTIIWMQREKPSELLTEGS